MTNIMELQKKNLDKNNGTEGVISNAAAVNRIKKKKNDFLV